jgi:hypothetical protein
MKPRLTNLKRRFAQLCRKAANVLDPSKSESCELKSGGTNPNEKLRPMQPQQPVGACDTDVTAGDFYSLISSLVDFVDELKLSADDKEKHPSSEQIRQMIIDKMELAEVTLIRLDTWDSSKQRAVKVASEDGSGIKVLSSTRTGVCHREKIIRKEEVVISK